MATTLTVGQIAITAVNTEDNGNPQRDLINILLLAPLDPGTVIYLTDRAWNGTTFAGAGGGDGTFAYTVPGGGLPAGSVLTITQAQLTAAGMNLSDAGDTIYLYQGASADSPTTFLHAVDIADGTPGFDGNELLNTGLTNGVSAVGISVDNAEFATRSWDIQRGDLFTAINTASHWAQNDNSPQDGTAMGSPTNVAPDAQIWIAGSGAGEAIVTINLDGTYSSGNVGYQISQAFQNDPGLYHPSDITLDTVHDRYFFVDSDAAGHNRILQGSISQVLANPGGPLTTTVLYTNAGSDANGIIQSLSVDTSNGIIYFDVGTDANGSTFNKIVANTANQASTVLATLGADQYVTQVAIDYAHGTVLLATSQISAFFGSDAIFQNYVYKATGLTAGSSSLTFTQLPFSPDDSAPGGEGSPLPGEAFPVELGNVRGIDIDPVTQIAYIVTGSASLDNDGDGNTTYYGGVYSYALTGNPTGTYTTLYHQDGVSGPPGLLYYVEVDHATGKYYVIDENGTNADPGDGGVYVGSLTVPGTPTLLATVGNINGLGPRGLEIQHASVLSGSALLATFTEAAGLGTAGVATAPAGSFQATDSDSGGDPNSDELAGAQVRISAGFQSGATHQDVLTINGNTSGSVLQGNGDTISFTYNSATGVLTLSGVSTLDNYEAMLGLVRFAVLGDNPTNYGTAGARTISYATFDGLLYSDEVSAGLTVSATNDAPVNAIPGGVTITEDASPGKVFSAANGNALSVSDPDADPASQPLRVTLTVGHGTLTLASLTGLSFIAGDGTGDATMTFTGTANAINAALGAGLTYTGTLDYFGADSLSIVTSDQGATGTGGAASDTDSVTITINGVADIVDDSLTVNEDAGATNVLVQGNDTFENGNHQITGISQGLHGTVSINTNGTAGNFADDYLVYTADANYFGADSFTYTVTSGGATETATVNVTVSAVNDAPTATATGANPTYVENAAAVTPFSGFTVNAGPNESAQTFTQLKLTVTNVESGHDALTIGGNTLTLTNGATSTQLGITATVTLVGATATVTFTSAGTTGAVLQGLINGMGYRYDGENPSSLDRVITITSLTDNGGTANGGVDTATLSLSSTVHVTPVNDAPVATVPGPIAIIEDAVPGQVFSAANANALHVSDVDANPATQSLSVTLSVAHGALTLASTAGLSFSVGDGAGDATVTFTGTANAINAAFDAGLTYTATADYNGADTLTLTTSDQGFSGTGGALSDSKTVAIAISAVTDIADDTATVNEDAATAVLVQANDSFENPDHAITAASALHGTVSINDNGTAGDTTDDYLEYQSNADYNGVDTISYTVTSAGVTETASVAVTVTAVADIAADSVTVGEDSGATTLDLLANDSFEDNNRAITAVGVAAHGTVAIDDNGTAGDATDDFVTYTADADYYGADSFTYTVTSGGATETTTVAVTVTAVADIADDTATTTEDAAVNILVQANDSFESATHAITAVGPAAHGSVAVDDHGTLSTFDDTLIYTADADYNGTDSFTYTVTSGGVTETATVDVTVTAVADIVADSVTVNEDSGATALDLLANDTFENANRAITAVGAAAHGTVAIDDNGTAGDATDDFVTYTADADYNGADSFTYTVTSGGVAETTTVAVTVGAVVDIADDTATTNEDTAVNVLVLANDSFESSAYAITATGVAAHGTVTINTNGTAGDTTDDYVVYTADADYNGADSFTYTVTSGGVTETATVNVTVGAVADIVADSVSVAEDSGATALDLLANDTFENANRAITAVGPAAHGTVAIDDNGTAGDATDDFVTYIADADYNGADSFTYTVTSGGVTETATVNVTVTAVADIVADTATTNEDTAVNVLVLANDSFESPTYAITATGAAAHGTVTIDTNGTAGDTTDDYLVYTADADYVGADSFTYTVTSGGVTETAGVNVTVTPVADIVADTVTVGEDAGTTALDLLANDTFENANRAITAVGPAAHGTVAIDDNGTAGDATDDFVTYTADADYNGADSFTYTVTSGGPTETITVNVNVTAVADIADDTATTNEDNAVNILVLANDSFEGSAYAITATGVAAHGAVTINTNGTAGDTTDDYIVYTANADYNGADSFTYTVTSGGVTETATVNVTVGAIADIVADTATTNEDTAVNVLVLANDSFESSTYAITATGAAAHGTVTVNTNGTAGDTTDDYLVYTADADYHGADSFTYTVTSGGVTETGTVNVTVGAVADIVADSVTTNEDNAVNVLVLANDSFESSAYAITATGAAAHGTVTINTNGTAGDTTDDYLVYTADADYNGTDSFTYTVTSGGVTETATVNVAVGAVADIVADSVNVNEDGGATVLDLLANDSFEDKKGAAITAVGAAAHGTVTINDNGTVGLSSDDYVVYTANADYNGADSFTYTVTAGGVTETATVNVTVNSVNDAPKGANGGATIAEDSTYLFSASDFGFSDKDGDVPLSVVMTTVPPRGQLVFDDGVNPPTTLAAGARVSFADIQAGHLSFVPDANANGIARLTFQVQDDGGTLNGGVDTDPTANIFRITVTPVDDAPVAVNDRNITTAENKRISIAVVANDRDVDGGPKAVTAVNGVALNAVGDFVILASGAKVTLAADGSLSYDPNHQFDYLITADLARRTGAVNDEATDTFTYTLNGGSSATVKVDVSGVTSIGDELRGNGRDNVITLYGNPVLVDGGAGFDTLIVTPARSFAPAPGEIVNFERILVRDGATLDLSALASPVGTIRAASVATTGLSITGTQGDDHIRGGLGRDTLIGAGGDDYISVSATPVRLDGGAGIDHVTIRSGDVVLTDANFAGVEAIRVKDGATLDMSGVTAAPAIIRGASVAGGGVEIIGTQARDHIVGGNGADVLTGGKGADIVTGGGGDDVFRFTDITDFGQGTLDRIMDFRGHHDTIDLSAIDPSAATGGDQAFTFIGGAAFTGNGGTNYEIRFDHVSGGNLLVQGDIDHDGHADFSFLVQAPTLHAADFIL